MGEVKILQDKIIQWTETQIWLLNLYLEEKIGKEEYKGRYDSLQEDIEKFKKEIHELVL